MNPQHPSRCRRLRVAAVSPCVLLLALSALGADYSLDWHAIAGGGGTSTGGVYSVSGTIGQPDAGQMSGGQYSLSGGFWSILVVVSNPSAPTLTISFNPQLSTVTISWPSASTGWVLQENTTGLSSANWTDHPFPQDNGTIKYITVSPLTGTRFYHLKK